MSTKPSETTPAPETQILSSQVIEALIVRLIPTSQYFEQRFDALEEKFDYKFEILLDRVSDLAKAHEDLKAQMDRRFEAVDRCFEAVDQQFKDIRLEIDKRFEAVDKRFEQVDKRFENIEIKLDKLIERIDRRVDESIRENRALTIRLFTFAMTFSAISLVGLIGRIFHVF